MNEDIKKLMFFQDGVKLFPFNLYLLMHFNNKICKIKTEKRHKSVDTPVLLIVNIEQEEH